MSSRDPAIRAKLLQSCPNICFICGYNKKDSDGNPLLDGAHIDDNAKNDANDHIRNMILLCPNHHREYDRGIIDFDKNGVIYTLDPTSPENGKTMAYYPVYIPPGTIEYHNQKKYKGTIMIDSRINR